MMQLVNTLTLSISLPGKACHIKGRDSYFRWAGSIESPELKDSIMLADINFKSISHPGKKGKKRNVSA